jgi:hypothetical protein
LGRAAGWLEFDNFAFTMTLGFVTRDSEDGSRGAEAFFVTKDSEDGS